MNHNDKVTVEARKKDGKIEFSPVEIALRRRDPHTRALTYEDEDRRWFSSFEEARTIADRYAAGPGDDVRSARWDETSFTWIIIEQRGTSSRRDSDREDFHSDG